MVDACSSKFGFKVVSERFSLVNRFRLYCDRSQLKNLVIFVTIFLGGLLYFIVSVLSDKFGRRTVFRISIILGIIGFICLVSSVDLFFAIVGLVLLCLTADTFYSLAFIYMSEISPPRLRNSSSLAMLISYFIGEMLGSFSGLCFKDYRHLGSFFFVLSLPIFYFYLTLKHSIFYLVKKGRRGSLLKLLSHMAHLNQVPPEYIKARLKNNRVNYFKHFPLDHQSTAINSRFHSQLPFKPSPGITVATGNQSDNFHPRVMARKLRLNETDLDPLFTPKQKAISSDVSLKEYFSKGRNVLKIVSYSLLVMNLYWIMGLTVFLPEIMGFKSLYLNNFFLAFADFFGVSMMVLFLNNTRRSFLNCFHLSLILVASIVLLLFHISPYKNYNFVKIIDLLLSCTSFSRLISKVACGCAIRSRWATLSITTVNCSRFQCAGFLWDCLFLLVGF